MSGQRKTSSEADSWEGHDFQRSRKNVAFKQKATTGAEAQINLTAYAALKGRSSTVVHAFVFSATFPRWCTRLFFRNFFEVCRQVGHRRTLLAAEVCFSCFDALLHASTQSRSHNTYPFAPRSTESAPSNTCG
jgi:hypothetical protein